MKKKICTPQNPVFIIVQVLLWTFVAISTIFIVLSSLDKNRGFKTLELFLSILNIFLFCFGLWSLFAFNIIINEKEIYCHGDGLPKFIKGQYKCKIRFEDITDIKIISSLKNSKNEKKKIKWSYPRRFIKFSLNNGTQEGILIIYFSKKQIYNLLQKVLYSMNTCGNPVQLNIEKIMLDWFYYSQGRAGRVWINKIPKKKKEKLIKQLNNNENNKKDGI